MNTTLAARIAAPFWRVTGWFFRHRPDPRDMELEELTRRAQRLEHERDYESDRADALTAAVIREGYAVAQHQGAAGIRVELEHPADREREILAGVGRLVRRYRAKPYGGTYRDGTRGIWQWADADGLHDLPHSLLEAATAEARREEERDQAETDRMFRRLQSQQDRQPGPHAPWGDYQPPPECYEHLVSTAVGPFIQDVIWRQRQQRRRGLLGSILGGGLG